MGSVVWANGLWGHPCVHVHRSRQHVICAVRQPMRSTCHFDDVALWSLHRVLLTVQVAAVGGEVGQQDAQPGSASMDS